MPLTQVQGGMLAGSTNTTTTIQSNGVTAMTIDSSQNVGIGTTSPLTKLHLQDNSAVFIQLTDSGDAASRIGQNGTALTFGVDLANGATERMRLASDGNLLVGGTSNVGPGTGRIAITSPDMLNTVAGLGVKNNANNTGGSFAFWVNSSNSIIGTISQNSSTTVGYNTSSDYRLKDNVQPMVGALDKVAQLKPVTFTWNTDNTEGQGFIAHELQAVVPDCVTGEKDAVDKDGNPIYQGVDTSFLVATLTAAIQELNAKVEAQAAEIAALKAAP